MQQTPKKKSSPLTGWLIVGIVVLASFLDGTADDVIFPILRLILFASPVLAGIGIFWFIKKQSSVTHTHDRIDHSSDLKIDPKTGKAVNRTIVHTPHSPKEHWQQQLDSLLANGFIDRNEYREMMKRKF